MKLGWIFALALALPLAACKKKDSNAFAGIVFDVGGIDDKSFNESAHRGLMRAKNELGIAVEYYEPKQPADRKTGLRRFSGDKVPIIIGVGFIFTDEIVAAAKDFKDLRFACVDMSDKADLPPNVLALKFREEEGSFLVGALAALRTQTKKVGFVGGMNVPLIHKFEAGFKAGVKQVASDVEIFVNYVGETPEAFQDPEKGKSLALGQYKSGADIIYHASGKSGMGVFEAAKEEKKFAIGVDSDQYSSAPGHVLTSMIKRVDVAVYETIKSVKEGKFQGGTRVFGLADDGIGFVYDQNNKSLIPEGDYKKVLALRDEIIAGKIKVPSTR